MAKPTYDELAWALKFALVRTNKGYPERMVRMHQVRSDPDPDWELVLDGGDLLVRPRTVTLGDILA